jgi:hypothetical protein
MGLIRSSPEEAMTQIADEKEIFEALIQLPLPSKRRLLLKLIDDLAELDRIIDQNQEHLRELCRARGLDFNRMSEREREELIDQILHE